MAFLHVNSNNLRRNRRRGTDEPVLVYRKTRSGKPVLCREVRFEGKGRLVYSPGAPLPCGAVAYVELEGSVELVLPEPPGPACAGAGTAEAV